MNYPENWDDKRQQDFKNLLGSYGIEQSNGSVIAGEIDRLGKLGYDACEETWNEHFLISRKITYENALLQIHREDALYWARFIVDSLMIRQGDPLVAKLVKLICLMIVGYPLMIFTIPTRLWFWIQTEKKEKNLISYKEWLELRLQRQHGTL